MDPDDLDDFLDGRSAEIEARFRQLELDAEIARMRSGSGGAPPPEAGEADAPPQGKKSSYPGDPLSDLKAALEQEQELPSRYLLVLCDKCQAKNRMSLKRVRTMNPICGRCKEDLSFEKDEVQ